MEKSPIQLILDLKVISQYRFDNFIRSAQNELAYQALRSVCESPFTRYNPLYIYGETGSGKTHLLKATVNYFYKHKPEWKIVYISTAEFLSLYNREEGTSEVIESIREYQEIQVLLLDDLHLLCGREKIQENIFHIYNTLMQSGKQVVLAGRMPPAEMGRLSNHLSSRFLSGPVFPMAVIDDFTRGEILRKLGKDYGITLTDSVIKYILCHAPRDISLFEDLIRKIRDSSLSRKREVSVMLVKDVLGGEKII